MSKIIVICGFSGAGKDTIAQYISRHYDYKMVISTTSRPMRANECEGNPYHFVNKEEFQDLISQNAFIEYRSYDTLLNHTSDTWYYGIEYGRILPNTNYIVALDLLGLTQFKKRFPNMVSFFIDVPDGARKLRAMLGRIDFDEVEWERRLIDDKRKFTQGLISKYVDYKVENLDFKKCIKQIMKRVDQWKENR